MRISNFNKIGKFNVVLAQLGTPKPEMTINFNCIVNKPPDPNYPNRSNSFINKYDFNNRMNYFMDFSGSYISILSKVNKSKINPNLNVSAAIYPRNWPELKRLLDLIDEWFTAKYIDLFIYDENDTPCSVNTAKYTDIPKMFKYKIGHRTCYVGAKPTIVTQGEDNYKGILLVCEDGVLGYITYDEYVYIRDVLKNTFENFYSMALNLVNTGLMYAIVENEGGNDNYATRSSYPQGSGNRQ